jgi:putative ABC transport system substrate-binding protein
MRRREFILLLLGATALPRAARAQAERVRRIGLLMQYASDDAEAQDRLAAFRRGLQELGWIEGRNLRGPAVTPPGLLSLNMALPESGWSCSVRSRPT